jgi:TolB protein
MSLRSTVSRTRRNGRRLILQIGLAGILCLFLPGHGFARIYIDINAPSVRKFQIAIPDFKNMGHPTDHPDLSTKLPEVISNDLDLSGYFSPMDKRAFLEEKDGPLTLGEIRFREWSVIGAELLLKAGYTCVGSELEVEVRLFDVFSARQILGKRLLGEISRYRQLIHRLGNDIIEKLTGHQGIFLSKVAFVGTASGNKEIYICDYDGHNVRQITADGSIALLPRFSPDGKKILYNSYKDGGAMLYLKDLESGQVSRTSSRSGLNIGASWTPDGKSAALTLSLNGNPDIFLIDMNGKILKRLVNHWGIDVSPAFSPDAKKMAFVSNRSGSPQIYLLDLNRNTEERLTFQGSQATSPAWSSLNRIAFSSLNDGNWDIFTMNADGSGLRALTTDQGNNEDPSWSPDGRYLMFSSNRTGDYHLYMMTANGQNQRQITFLTGEQTAPSWAP